MWTLARLLPVMIGQYVDEDDKHWQHFSSVARYYGVYIFTDCTAHYTSISKSDNRKQSEILSGIIPRFYLYS